MNTQVLKNGTNGLEVAAPNSRAIVIGGSMAGMLAARVLADYFGEVQILDSDRFPESPTARKGVPQARHVHVLMLRGQQILEHFFPGIRTSVLAGGAQLLDMAGDVEWLTPAGWGVRFPSPLNMLACTRDLLEWHVRQQLLTHPRVCFREETRVSALLPDHDGRRIIGVRIESHGEAMRDLGADLVVDASGRDSKSPDWLQSIGFQPPEEVTVNAFLGYASRIYGQSSKQRYWKGAYLQMAPPVVTRGGLVLPIEGNRFLVTLAGIGRDYPPTDESGFVEFAASLRSKLVSEFIRDAVPLSPISGFRHTENRWHRYERFKSWPGGFAVLGDAVCTFNPVYAQGMTTAALSALTLQQCLQDQARRSGDQCDVGQRLRKRLARVNAVPWLLATGEDFRVPIVEGGPPTLSARVMHRYMDQVVRLTTHNEAVRLVMLEVMHMLKRPSALFGPSILLNVAKQVLGAQLRPKIQNNYFPYKGVKESAAQH